MPDFTIGIYGSCNSNKFWQTVVPSETTPDKTYTVSWRYQPEGPVQYDYECTCWGYTRHGHCKHIKAVRAIQGDMAQGGRCGWHQFLDGGEPVKDEEGKFMCPECGAPVNFERWAE